MPRCPSCHEELHISPQAQLGQFIDCKWCGEELEIVAVEPFEVEKAPSINDYWGE